MWAAKPALAKALRAAMFALRVRSFFGESVRIEIQPNMTLAQVKTIVEETTLLFAPANNKVRYGKCRVNDNWLLIASVSKVQRRHEQGLQMIHGQAGRCTDCMCTHTDARFITA